MSTHFLKKQDEINQKKIRDILRLKENAKCFDCPNKGPSNVNVTIQTFVCARCSGLVREVGHRVKSVSASKFTQEEIIALTKGGNEIARRIWLSNYSTPNSPEPESDQDVRGFIRQKYYELKWLDRALLYSHNEEIRALIENSATKEIKPIVSMVKNKASPGSLPLSSSNFYGVHQDSSSLPFPSHTSVVPSFSQSSSNGLKSPVSPTYSFSSEINRVSIDSQRSNSSTSSSTNKLSDLAYANRDNHDYTYSNNISSNRQSLDSVHSSLSSGSFSPEYHYQNNPYVETQPRNNSHHITNTSSPTLSKPTPNSFNSIISELSSLNLEKPVIRPTYTGGILSPAPVASQNDKNDSNNLDFFSKLNKANTTVPIKNDQYAALRGISTLKSNTIVHKEDDKIISSSEDDEDDDPWQDFCSSSNFEDDIDVEPIPQIAQQASEKLENSEPIVSIDVFSDLDPLSMFKKF